MSPVHPLVTLEAATKAYGPRVLLDQVSLGVAVGDRIGVVGRNGAGKSTLLEVLAGHGGLDSGRATRARDLDIGYLPQAEELTGTVRKLVFGSLPEHEWAGDARGRSVIAALLPGIDPEAAAERMSGGERRRVALARLLLAPHDLLLLDEPTNHLDIDAVQWLAGYLREHARSFVVVTHDRWFLDAVTERTWEVADGHVYCVRGRLLGVRAGQGGAGPDRRRHRRRAAETCCARSWPGSGAARRPGPASPSSGWRPPPP